MLPSHEISGSAAWKYSSKRLNTANCTDPSLCNHFFYCNSHGVQPISIITKESSEESKNMLDLRDVSFGKNSHLRKKIPLSESLIYCWNVPSVKSIPPPRKNGLGFLGGSVGKESACSAGDPGSIPGSGRSPGGGNGNSLQHSCLENSMDRGITEIEQRL